MYMHILTHSFNKHLLSTYCVLRSAIGNGDVRVSKGDMLFDVMGPAIWHIHVSVSVYLLRSMCVFMCVYIHVCMCPIKVCGVF